MKDFIVPPPDIERAAEGLDPEAWRSAATQKEAASLRYRRYRAREQAGWPNEHWPRDLNPIEK